MGVDDVSGHGPEDSQGNRAGLLESVYESLLAKELERRNLRVERQRSVDFEFDGLKFDRAFCLHRVINKYSAPPRLRVMRSVPPNSLHSTPNAETNPS